MKKLTFFLYWVRHAKEIYIYIYIYYSLFHFPTNDRVSSLFFWLPPFLSRCFSPLVPSRVGNTHYSRMMQIGCFLEATKTFRPYFSSSVEEAKNHAFFFEDFV